LIHSSVALSVSLTAYYYHMTSKSSAYLLYIIASSITYYATYKMIPKIKLLTLKAGLFGKDINKKGTQYGEVPVPESLGIVPATIFVAFNMIGILYTKVFDEKSALEHTAGILSICFIIFLGFCDDVLDLPWRYKILLPNIATLPLIVAYSGVTHVVVPIMLRPYLGDYIDLGNSLFSIIIWFPRL